MSYEVVRYCEELKPGVLDLLVHAWGPDRARNERCFAWKFEQNPFLARPLLHLVVHENRVVAMRAVHGAYWLREHGGARLPALGTGDFVIDPAHRGRHLFGRIANAAAADVRRLGFRYLINLSASPVTYLRSIRAGWRDLGPLGTLRRATTTARAIRLAYAAIAGYPLLADVSRRLQSRLRRDAAVAPRAADRRFRALESGVVAASRRSGWPLTVAREARPEAMSILIDRIDPCPRQRHARSAEFFAWRFRNPLSTYRFLYWGDATLEGMLVLETPRDVGRNRVRIVHCAAVTLGVRRSLLGAAIELGRFRDLRLWSAGLGTAEVDWLKGEGFVEASPLDGSRYRHALLAWDLESGGQGVDPLPEIDRWRLEMIDSDKC